MSDESPKQFMARQAAQERYHWTMTNRAENTLVAETMIDTWRVHLYWCDGYGYTLECERPNTGYRHEISVNGVERAWGKELPWHQAKKVAIEAAEAWKLKLESVQESGETAKDFLKRKLPSAKFAHAEEIASRYGFKPVKTGGGKSWTVWGREEAAPHLYFWVYIGVEHTTVGSVALGRPEGAKVTYTLTAVRYSATGVWEDGVTFAKWTSTEDLEGNVRRILDAVQPLGTAESPEEAYRQAYQWFTQNKYWLWQMNRMLRQEAVAA